MKKIGKLLVIGALVLTVTGCGEVNIEVNSGSDKTTTGGITLEEYNKITTGMSWAEVKKIVGNSCTKTGTTELAGITQDIYTCEGEASNSTVMLTFQNDSLQLKTQVGLK